MRGQEGFSSCGGLMMERNDRRKEWDFYLEIHGCCVTHIFRLKTHFTFHGYSGLLSASLSVVTTSENRLFTRSLPEWKISSASVKITSKTENPP